MENAGEEVCIPPSTEFERVALAVQVTRNYAFFHRISGRLHIWLAQRKSIV